MMARVDVMPYVLMSLFQLFVAAFVKAIYFYWITRVGAGSTINTATGFTRARVRLLDAGHTHGTFLTQEFGYRVQNRLALTLKALSMLLAFGLPLLFLGLALKQPSMAIGLAALLSVFAGMIVERWLFFAEARHVVNLFHGAQRC
jgi:DMSO reductase anchor subunit